MNQIRKIIYRSKSDSWLLVTQGKQVAVRTDKKQHAELTTTLLCLASNKNLAMLDLRGQNISLSGTELPLLTRNYYFWDEEGLVDSFINCTQYVNT